MNVQAITRFASGCFSHGIHQAGNHQAKPPASPQRSVSIFQRGYWLALVLLLSGCDSLVLDAWEQLGVHKRDILIDRIVDAQTAQKDGQEQFKSALEQFKSVINFSGGDLETAYNALNSEYEKSIDAAEEISDHINSVESVADALFDEWQSELAEYTSQALKRDSERQLRATKKRYSRVINAMRSAEASIEPVLASLKDNVLYLKHNLNSRAIASLQGELATVNTDVARLVTAMNTAINESNAFISELRNSQSGSASGGR